MLLFALVVVAPASTVFAKLHCQGRQAGAAAAAAATTGTRSSSTGATSGGSNTIKMAPLLVLTATKAKLPRNTWFRDW